MIVIAPPDQPSDQRPQPRGWADSPRVGSSLTRPTGTDGRLYPVTINSSSFIQVPRPCHKEQEDALHRSRLAVFWLLLTVPITFVLTPVPCAHKTLTTVSRDSGVNSYVSQVSLSTSVRDCSLGWPPSRRTASYPQPAGTSGTQTNNLRNIHIFTAQQ